MDVSAKQFEEQILDSGYVLDPDGIHHEFASGAHGRKLDFDSIPANSELFSQWVELAARKLKELYSGHDLGRLVLVSVANGTNRVVSPVAETVGRITAVMTEKVPENIKQVKLSDESKHAIYGLEPQIAVVLEDVGTTGTTTSTAVKLLQELEIPVVECISTWQRQLRLPALDNLGVRYYSIIDTQLPTFTPEECKFVPEGYCNRGWQLINR